MGLILNSGFTIGPGVVLNSGTPAPPAPTGLTSSDPSTSAYAIKQAYPSSPDGLYWIQNDNFNGKDPVQIYADMTTDGGGWTLIMQNNYPDWSYGTALLRNSTSPPSTLGSINYSIIGWADYIKRSASGFDYMLEAVSRNSNGGIFTANEAYSFTGQVDLTAYAAQGSGPYFGGTQYNTDEFNAVISTGNGFRQNITLKTKFGTWNYNNNGLEKRMPWYTGNSPGLAGEAIFTTTHDDPGSWWGSLMDYDASFSPAPWQNDAGVDSPGIIWYWVR